MSMEYEIGRYTQDKNPNSHIHENFEILISLNSEGIFFVREHGYTLRIGMVFVLPPFEIHRCFCSGSCAYDRYIIHFSPELLKEMSTCNTDLCELFGASPIIYQARDEALAKILASLSYLSKDEEGFFGEDVARNLRFRELLLEIAMHRKADYNQENPPVDKQGKVEGILDYIRSNYAGDITLDTIARDLSMSRSQLSQIFKNATGFSIGDYIIMYRVKRACALLRSGMSVHEAGLAVGFGTTASFIRTFKKRMGCSPGRFVPKSEK